MRAVWTRSGGLAQGPVASFRQANAEKIEAIENVLRHAEDMASFMHMTKGQSQKFRQQVEQHLLQPSLADGWSANGKAGLHPPADPPANGAPAEDTQQATIDELQEEVRQLRTENEFLRSAAVQEQAERQAEGAEDEEAAAKAAVDQEKLLKDLQAKHDRVIDLEIGMRGRCWAGDASGPRCSDVMVVWSVGVPVLVPARLSGHPPRAPAGRSCRDTLFFFFFSFIKHRS